MQLPDPRLWLVCDPDDKPESTRALHALSDLDRGVVVVRVTPGPRVLHTIAMDVLRALGKEQRRPGLLRSGEENWRRCAAWLSAERAQHLVVDRAEMLQPKRWLDFIGLASHCGTSLWLIVHGGSLKRMHLEAMDDWPFTQITFEEFMAERVVQAAASDAADDEPRGSAAPQTAFPALPRSDFTTFRADCRLLLTAHEFERVEREMRYAADRTRRWLDADSQPDTPAMKEHLRELIEHCESTDQALTRLRAAQAVSLMRGLLVTVDLERLASTLHARPRIDGQLVSQLREYSSTKRAAVALLACLPRSSPLAISRMSVSDVTDTEVRIAGATVALPGVARPVLAAHVHSQLLVGARPEDPLFSDGLRGILGERSTPRAIRLAISDVARTNGLMLWSEWHNEDHSSRRWLRRRGVTVQVLP